MSCSHLTEPCLGTKRRISFYQAFLQLLFPYLCQPYSNLPNNSLITFHMKLILAFTLISSLTICSLIDSNSQPGSDAPRLPPVPSPPVPTNYTGQDNHPNTQSGSVGSLQSIQSLLAHKYNSLLSESNREGNAQNNSSTSSISSTLKAYQQQLLNYYRNNQPIPGLNGSSQDNVDNGQNNTINGKKNVIKAGDYNTITGTANTVNGSYNQIIGHNDVVHGTGNIVISNPQAIPGFNFVDPLRSQTKTEAIISTEPALRINSSIGSNATESMDSFVELNSSNSTQQAQSLNHANEKPASNHQEESITKSISISQEAIQQPKKPSAALSSETTTTKINSNTHVSSQNSQPALIVALAIMALLMLTAF